MRGQGHRLEGVIRDAIWWFQPSYLRGCPCLILSKFECLWSMRILF